MDSGAGGRSGVAFSSPGSYETADSYTQLFPEPLPRYLDLVSIQTPVEQYLYPSPPLNMETETQLG